MSNAEQCCCFRTTEKTCDTFQHCCSETTADQTSNELHCYSEITMLLSDCFR